MCIRDRVQEDPGAAIAGAGGHEFGVSAIAAADLAIARDQHCAATQQHQPGAATAAADATERIAVPDGAPGASHYRGAGGVDGLSLIHI